jgi:hypothetical protein
MTKDQTMPDLETPKSSPYRIANFLGIASGIALLAGMCMPAALAGLIALMFGMRSLLSYREIRKSNPTAAVPLMGKMIATIACTISAIFFVILALLFLTTPPE